MSKHLNVVEAELTEAQCAELDAAKGNPDLTQTILQRIAEEVMARRVVNGFVESIEEVADKLRERLLSDVLLCTHWLMHKARDEEAKELLCPMAAILEGTRPPMEVMEGLLRKIDAINLEREPVEGHA